MSEWKEYCLSDLAEIHNEIRVPLSKIERTKRIEFDYSVLRCD